MNPSITIQDTGEGTLTIDGADPLTLSADTPDAAYHALLRRASRFAEESGEPLTVTVTTPEATREVNIDPDGTASALRSTPSEDDTRPAEPTDRSPHRGITPSDDHVASVAPRSSFLTTNRIQEPATHGWQGLLNHLGFRLAPGPAEQSAREDTTAVSQRWPGVRTIVVANGKGGAGKTPTTALLSAVLARYGGAGVVAWDTNQTRGTLGWRTEQGPHEATVLDLLPQVDHLLGTDAQSADLAHFMHHQTEDRYDVLRSQPMELAADQRITPTAINHVIAVLAKYYRLILTDTGNDESDPAWLQVVSHADLLVVATSTRDDHAEAGALLLEKLADRGPHESKLAANSVAVITQADPRANKTDIQRVTDGYATLSRQVVTIPHDPAMVDGWLRWNTLRPSTQRAWLAAAAAVARGL